MDRKAYLTLAAVLSVNTAIMFVLTFAMIARWSHFHANLNNLYMALMMVAPMGVIMLLAMPKMFPDRKLNLGLHAFFAVLFLAAYFGGRSQAAVGDDGFLRAMIPHHSRAILVCEEAQLSDPRNVDLCARIVEAQRREIAEMEGIMASR